MHNSSQSSTALQSSLSPANSSRTLTITADQTQQLTDNPTHTQDSGEGTGAFGVLRLRGARNSSPRVAWDEDVVDNEHMGKKKSKICCIYHKPRPFDESSSEESSPGEDSDSECGGAGHSYKRKHHHRHRHNPRECGSGGESEGSSEPNAYERQPSRAGS